MNYSTLSIAPIILALSLGNAYAEDYATAHTFSSGDVISADMMNELFDYIENANRMISASDLIGTWSCTRYAQTTGCGGSGWAVGTDSVYRSNSGTLVMIDDGDDTYSYTTSAPNMFSCGDPSTGLGNWVVKNNILFNDFSSGGVKGNPSLEAQTMYVKLKKVSNSKLLMEIKDATTVFAECDKQATPPTNPTAFAATTTSLSNVLTWTDNSSDESGFKIYKKTTVSGAWTLIDAGAGLTVSTNVVTYTDTVSAAGDSWYRVKANHVTNGDSIGSKVIKVTNSN